MELSSSRPSPRHRWDEIHRPAYSAYSAAPSSVATSRQRPAVTRAATLLLSSPSGMRHHSSDTPLIGRPPAVPSFPRASTAPIGKAAFENYDPRAHPGISRASLHRDLSPRSAAPYFRSTPDSRRSMRSSLSESDNDTDLTRPTPEEDDKDEEDEDGRAADTIFVDKKALRDRMDIRKRPSQEYPTASSMKQHSARQSQNQKQKQRGRVRGDDLDLHEEGDEVAVAQQETQGFPQRSQQKRGHHGHRSRRSSGSRGAGGGSSSRGRRYESVIPEEATEDQQADADAEMDNDDFDDDRRRTPSRHTRRSASRNTTATHDVRRDLSRSKSRLRHADSDEFNPRASSRR
ncbi:hypothetical protein HMPREF1624_03270 [Sporothrix schenckii ATCC 58251]|uniref:Uncharacterized protein n=1 Tax=Sporothrix schenckii (strain ATCC 58251 / de Perez 2211183) TaxID=1391915 RepID=U7PWF9_SPOS1|nr:hypothetical protein HMPREF1624_03270 [Sporothrix schenckii ATCC 58251]